jgi:hypothetical protein
MLDNIDFYSFGKISLQKTTVTIGAMETRYGFLVGVHATESREYYLSIPKEIDPEMGAELANVIFSRWSAEKGSVNVLPPEPATEAWGSLKVQEVFMFQVDGISYPICIHEKQYASA